jgi:hypothetical protein
MTLRYSIDISKSLTDNVRAINDLIFEEMRQFDYSNSPNIQQRLEISVTDFHLLMQLRNSFEVTGMKILKKCHPTLQLIPQGNYDASLVADKLAEWKRLPSYVASEEMQRNLTKWRLQSQGLIV